mgnify:CR=1 FL=1
MKISRTKKVENSIRNGNKLFILRYSFITLIFYNKKIQREKINITKKTPIDTKVLYNASYLLQTKNIKLLQYNVEYKLLK